MKNLHENTFDRFLREDSLLTEANVKLGDYVLTIGGNYDYEPSLAIIFHLDKGNPVYDDGNPGNDARYDQASSVPFEDVSNKIPESEEAGQILGWLAKKSDLVQVTKYKGKSVFVHPKIWRDVFAEVEFDKLGIEYGDFEIDNLKSLDKNIIKKVLQTAEKNMPKEIKDLQKKL